MTSTAATVSLLMLLLCPALAQPLEYTDPGYYLEPILRIKIVPTFDSPTIYEVNRHEPFQLTVTRYSGKGGYDWDGIESAKNAAISDTEHEEILALLEKALGFPKNDDFTGKDGSTWMLESSLYQYTAVALWEPEFSSEARGIQPLVELKELLEAIETGVHQNAYNK